MRRRAYQELLLWKNKPNRKPLILKGARHTGKTLIILDEVQEVPGAVAALKYFCEDAGEYHVAVAGSPLSTALQQGVSFPVGKVQSITLHPMDFEEYLQARAGEELLAFLLKEKPRAWERHHETLMGYVWEYCFTGGMPEAVKTYIQTREVEKTRTVQKRILRDFAEDVSQADGDMQQFLL